MQKQRRNNRDISQKPQSLFHPAPNIGIQTSFSTPCSQLRFHESQLGLVAVLRSLPSLSCLPAPMSFTRLPTPPLPTWYTGTASAWRRSLSNSSSNLNIGRCSWAWWTLPAPPRPVANLVFLLDADEKMEDEDGSTVVLVEGRADGGGGRVKLPAPPRPVGSRVEEVVVG